MNCYRCLPLLALLCLASLFAADSGAQKVVPELKKLHEFKVPDTAFHSCLDPEEAERRWKASNEMSSVDVYIMNGEERRFSLMPVVKQAVVRKIGGGSATEPGVLGIDVTESQRLKIEEALKNNKLFIVHYHYGW